MKYLILFIIFASGCGIHVSSDPIKVDPVTVTVNFETVATYCSANCVNNQDPAHCADECYNQFFNIFHAAVKTTN